MLPAAAALSGAKECRLGCGGFVFLPPACHPPSCCGSLRLAYVSSLLVVCLMQAIPDFSAGAMENWGQRGAACGAARRAGCHFACLPPCTCTRCLHLLKHVPPLPTPRPAGVITYRETALLASNSSSTLDLRYIAVVVAHEMAHQWFGNLVTMVGGGGRTHQLGRA